ncbi:MAG: ATP-binding cassette domain-containing protein, partial [Mycobacterium sp.]
SCCLLRGGESGYKVVSLGNSPYVPLGTPRGVVCYPNAPEDIPEPALRDALAKVALTPLYGQLDEEQNWAKVLSPGEQQRVAFARVLLSKPQAVFLDESTSALDAGLEFALYQMLRSELPDCVVVSVSHRRTVEQHHRQELTLPGNGKWRLGPVEMQPAPA